LDATKAADRTFFYRVTRQPKSFPGTGDIFASVLLGALMRGDDLYTATRAAADFVGEVIAYSQNCGEPTRDGVLLEPLLWKLAKGV
jgi:pyridoxine kinase